MISDNETKKQGKLVEVEKGIAAVNRSFEVRTQARIDIALLRSEVKENIAALQGGPRERKRDGFAARFRRLAVRHVGVRRQTRWNSASAHHEHPVVVSGGSLRLLPRHSTGCRSAYRNAVAAVAEAEPAVKKQSGQNDRHEYRAIRVNRAVRRPDDCFLASPLCRCHCLFPFAGSNQLGGELVLRIADFIEQFVERLRRESLACGQRPQYVYEEQANPKNLGQRWIAGRSFAQLPEDHIANPFA
jgi:hypothetical protein